MSKSIVELIAENQSTQAVSVVEKALTKKMLKAITEQASVVAREAYGSLAEYFGGDEQPDYMNNNDNAYAVFFANALKKFGVAGPEDFTDDVTKQRFFDYVDHNWRAQDTVQGPVQGAQGGSMELGTQTALPPPATPPMAPTAPTQTAPATAQGNDPSLATMAPAGPSIDKTAPLDQSGQDPTLNGVQNTQTFGGVGPQAGGMLPGMTADGCCPMCKGSGKASCPTCNRPHEAPSMDDGMGGGMDQDPDLEIGPEDDGMGGDAVDEFGNPTDEEGMMGDGQEADLEGGDDMNPNGQEEELDDPFDDEDAFTIDASDFNQDGGGGEDSNGVPGDLDGDGMEDDEDPDDNGDEEDSDDQFVTDDGTDENDEDADEDGGNFGDQGDDVEEVSDDDDEDPDLEVTDDDSDDDGDDYSDEDEGDEVGNQDEDAPVFNESRKSGKKTRLTEDFGFGLDNAEDDIFLAEAMMMAAQQQQPQGDPSLDKLIQYVQAQLSKIKKLRNTMLMQLRRQRSVIKKDPALDGEAKMDALKQLATMAKDNRKFFKGQAKLVKAMFTGNLGGGSFGGDDDQDMDMDGGDDGQDMDQQDQGSFPPKKGGFPQGNDDGDEDEDQDPDMEIGDDDDSDEEDDDDGGIGSNVDENGDDLPDDDDSDEEDTGDEEAVVVPKKKFPQGRV